MTAPSYDVLIPGFPGRTPRGFLGWSTTVLLHTRDGYALFDTGGAGDRPGILNALERRGLTPADIRTVVLSHLHFDHVANVECFPKAELVLHETELAYFDEHKADDRAIPLFQVEGLLRSPQLSLVSGELDVLPGIRMIRTPGHTGGHASLVLSVDGKCVVLAQDAVKHRGEIETLNSAGAFDNISARESIRRIAAMADIVVPGHDASLTIANGKVASAGALSEVISLSLEDRSFVMEV
ncbi:MBL fold metallo-hydrolase [Mesorhizobium sp. CGMCC 1.15528]|uniref:MBL fold metallo-hydrolase n=1 Tax=Mesorhizobium zhangyense TaxID=1776730 RepID=A0A7C9VGP6_9HYPH|nr:MBL fold metallo-hydrolase [Mesorhizobium zhangyense]NGN45029.1 MBL fold metallo-hydrolase [Mesorhizobium zhangyense]